MYKVNKDVIDMKDVFVEIGKKNNPWTTFLLSKAVKATAPLYGWVQESINDSAVTMPEGGDAPAYVGDNKVPKQNFLELFGVQATVSNTAQASSIDGITDLLAKEVDSKTKSLKRRVEDKLLHGVGSYTTSTGTYNTAGILEQIDTTHKLTGAAFNDVEFEKMLEKLYDAGVSDNMVCFLPAAMKKELINSTSVVHLAREKWLEFDVDVYSTVFGTISFVLCEGLGTKTAFVVNPDYMELAVLIPVHGQVEPVSGSKQSIYIETQLGCVLLNERAASSFTVTP